VTVFELAHGIERAKLQIHREFREAFLNDLLADIKVYRVTTRIARLAGRVSGQQALRGIVIPFEDLLIGATALHHGFDVITTNQRHFEMIPELRLKSL
jgi:predicted nucleic acid-binding protein